MNIDFHLPHHTEVSPALVNNIDSDDIQVVFEADSHQMDDNSTSRESLEPVSWQQDLQENNRNARDHRPKMRNTFKLCFTGNTQPDFNFGKVLAECSDDE